MMRRQDSRGEDADQASAEHRNKGNHADEQAGGVDHQASYRSQDEASPRLTRAGRGDAFGGADGRSG